ncbi:MAG: glycosyltransferase family 9 protein, partial [Cyclobacteriaceae bacterium]|nr:glycosyltransferase family 9 protein [Cyclobacteriaceae bacterium]
IDFIQSIPGDLSVFLLGGSKDANLCEEIISNCSSKKISNLAGKLSLLESAALMRDAKMNYVNDSAPLHLASAMNAPVTAVYCSTIPTFGFGPLSDKSFVVETEEKLDCRPCGLHGSKACPKGHFKCATTIGVEKLLLPLR